MMNVRRLIRFVSAILGARSITEEIPATLKAQLHLKYWEGRKVRHGVLKNAHFEHFYTTQFGLEGSFFRGRKILDAGCGPRGSLEWAKEALVRVGLDPLAVEYRRLGTGTHQMQYVAARSERMPFPDGSFDVVCSFNSLDHVDNLDETTSEVIRVLAPNGIFLLHTDIHDMPTPKEPIAYSWNVVEKFCPDLILLEERHYEKSARGMYASIRAGIPYDHANPSKRYGVLSAKFSKGVRNSHKT